MHCLFFNTLKNDKKNEFENLPGSNLNFVMSYFRNSSPVRAPPSNYF